jgi:hypothetical protein
MLLVLLPGSGVYYLAQEYLLSRTSLQGIRFGLSICVFSIFALQSCAADLRLLHVRRSVRGLTHPEVGVSAPPRSLHLVLDLQQLLHLRQRALEVFVHYHAVVGPKGLSSLAVVPGGVLQVVGILSPTTLYRLLGL